MDIAFLRWKQKEERVGICFTLFFTSILLGLESMHGYLILGLACVCMSPVGVFGLVEREGENIVGWGFFFREQRGLGIGYIISWQRRTYRRNACFMNSRQSACR
jgi:hypothetical protein